MPKQTLGLGEDCIGHLRYVGVIQFVFMFSNFYTLYLHMVIYGVVANLR